MDYLTNNLGLCYTKANYHLPLDLVWSELRVSLKFLTRFCDGREQVHLAINNKEKIKNMRTLSLKAFQKVR